MIHGHEAQRFARPTRKAARQPVIPKDDTGNTSGNAPARGLGRYCSWSSWSRHHRWRNFQQEPEMVWSIVYVHHQVKFPARAFMHASHWAIIFQIPTTYNGLRQCSPKQIQLEKQTTKRQTLPTLHILQISLITRMVTWPVPALLPLTLSQHQWQTLVEKYCADYRTAATKSSKQYKSLFIHLSESSYVGKIKHYVHG
jgi:hypothetical protein